MKLVNVVLWAPCLLYLLILRRDGREFMSQAMPLPRLYSWRDWHFCCTTTFLWRPQTVTSAQNKFTLEFLRRDIADSLLTPQRGLFTFNPILLAAIPGWFVFFRKKMPEAVLLLGIFALWFPFMASLDELPGGWAWATGCSP